MLPPFDAILFDFDGTLASSISISPLCGSVVALAVTYGLAAATLEGMYILEMVEYATTLLQQQPPKRGEDFFQQAHQLIQDIEIEAAQSAASSPVWQNSWRHCANVALGWAL